MRPNPGDAMNLNDLAGPLIDLMPEEWSIEIRIVHGEISISLYDPDGNDVDVCLDDLTTNEYMLEMVNHARAAEGLPAGAVPGLGYFRREPDGERFYQVAPVNAGT